MKQYYSIAIVMSVLAAAITYFLFDSSLFTAGSRAIFQSLVTLFVLRLMVKMGYHNDYEDKDKWILWSVAILLPLSSIFNDYLHHIGY